MRADGPFRITRHPLNLATPVVLWLNPTMTTNLATLSAVSTAYFLLGSIREEVRLRAPPMASRMPITRGAASPSTCPARRTR